MTSINVEKFLFEHEKVSFLSVIVRREWPL